MAGEHAGSRRQPWELYILTFAVAVIGVLILESSLKGGLTLGKAIRKYGTGKDKKAYKEWKKKDDELREKEKDGRGDTDQPPDHSSDDDSALD